MPSSDTSDLSETSVGLPWQLGGTPTCGNTLVTVTPGDSDDIDDLVGLENRVDVDSLLEVRLCEFNLVSDGTTVDLDLHKMSLLLLKTSLSDLGVGENSDDSAVLADSLEFTGDSLTRRLGVLLGVLGESLLL